MQSFSETFWIATISAAMLGGFALMVKVGASLLSRGNKAITATILVVLTIIAIILISIYYKP